jgi:hypothetical protein
MYLKEENIDMSQLQAETRRKPLRINENKIRTLEVSGIDEPDRVQEEEPVTPSKPVSPNASNRHRLTF